MNERYLRWYTPHLSRDFEMLVLGNGGGLPLILFPTSFGNFRQCKDFNLVVACATVCGASLGAYRAAHIAFRHPDLVSHLISLSGAFHISDFSMATMTRTFIATALTSTSRTCRTPGDSIT